MNSAPVDFAPAAAPRRRSRRWLIVLAVLAAMVFAAVSSVKAYYSRIVQQQLVSAARAAGAVVEFGDPSFGFTSMATNTLSVFIPKYFLAIETQKLSLSVGFLSLLGLSPSLSFHAHAYGGDLAVEGFYSIRKSSGAISRIDLAHLQPALHPQIAGLGLSGGSISVSVKDFDFSEQGPIAGEFSMDIENAALATAALASLLKAPLDMLTPEISGIKLHAGCGLKASVLACPDLTLASSLGSMHGSASATFGGTAARLQGDFRVALSDAAAKLRGFLPMVSNQRVSADAKEFTLALGGTLRNPVATLK